MTQLNMYSLYSMNNNSIMSVNEVSALLNKLDNKDYNQVKDYLYEKFGDFNDSKIIDYPKTNEKLEISIDDKYIGITTHNFIDKTCEIRTFINNK